MGRLFSFLVLVTISSALAAEANGPFGDNFYEVDAGKIYRSGQLSAKTLAAKIDKHHFRTILNLRGESKDSWYREEAAVAKERGVTLINIHMSASRIPHRAELRKLIETFDSAELPMLVHCQAGADRTGEAMVIYALDYLHQPLADALKNLSPKYHHYSLFLPAPDYFVKDVYRGRAWALDTYDPCGEATYQYYDRAKYCR